MMRKICSSVYRFLASSFKKLDKLASYKLGIFVRKFTDINTKRYWDKYFSQYNESWRDFPYRFLMEFLPKDAHFTLLDIGCALGDGCRLLKKSFPRADISGADFSELAISKARAHASGIDFFTLDIKENEPPKKYDFITLLHILEHFNDPFPILDKCLRFVNQAVIVITPYIKDFDNPRLYAPGEHRYLFNEKTFEDYNSQILLITEYLPKYGYSYIVYKITPK